MKMRELKDITEIFFKIGGYFGGFHKLLIRTGEQGTAVCAYHTEWGHEADSFSVKPFSDDDLKSIYLFLTEKLQVWTWKHDYVDDSICDGTEWCLGFTFADGSQHGINGVNDFPPMFDKLEKRFEKLYKEVFASRVSLSEIGKYLPLFEDVEGIPELMKLAERQHCPVCGSDLIRIFYGMPTRETYKLVEDNPGWFELGGCCCWGDERDAEFRCPECNLRFSRDLEQMKDE